MQESHESVSSSFAAYQGDAWLGTFDDVRTYKAFYFCTVKFLYIKISVVCSIMFLKLNRLVGSWIDASIDAYVCIHRINSRLKFN